VSKGADNVQVFLTTLVSFPTIVFTFALLLALLYWLVVIFGALDLDFLDSALGLDAMDGAVDGALESLDGVADGLTEGAADALDGAIEGSADVADVAEADAADGARTGALSGLLNAMGVRGVPITIVVTFVTFWGWVVSYLTTRFLGRATATVLAGLAVTATSLLAAIVLGALTTRPFRRLFVTQNAPRRASLVGKMCTVTSARVDERFGRAEIEDGAAGFVAEVRCTQENNLTRGSKALVYRYEPADGIFFIGPVDAALDEATRLTADSGSPTS